MQVTRTLLNSFQKARILEAHLICAYLYVGLRMSSLSISCKNFLHVQILGQVFTFSVGSAMNASGRFTNVPLDEIVTTV